MWKTDKIYKVDKMGERVESCPTPMLTLKKREEELF